jgi:putative FmdB family regulatory protein
MPIYEYICDAPRCGHTFDVLQKMSDDPIRTCPQCKKRQVRKLVSASAFILKGSGWYQNDIARKEKTEKAARESKLKVGKEGKGEKVATDGAAPQDSTPLKDTVAKEKSPAKEKPSKPAPKAAATGA